MQNVSGSRKGDRGRVPETGLRRTGTFAAFTLVELIVSVAIISILVLAGLPGLLQFQTRAKVAACKNNQRILADALSAYHLDYGSYPSPDSSLDDPFGVLARRSLTPLTTPIAYVGPDALFDAFGSMKVQFPAMTSHASLTDDPFRPPTPGFNTQQSLLYFHYPTVAVLLGQRLPSADAFAVVSVGPDLKDSFIVYYPFPDRLPAWAALYGIGSVLDCVYDPTNGTVSSGDLAAFGGSLSVPRFVGGGN